MNPAHVVVDDDENKVAWRRVRGLFETVEWASHDRTTGVLTRGAWSVRATAELAEPDPSATGHSPALLVMDVDHLEQLNSRHGRRCGDTALRAVGWVMRSELRHVDLLGRYGGGGFVALLVGAYDEVAVIELAERLRRQIAVLRAPGLGEVALRVWIGAALAPADPRAGSLGALIERAEGALFKAKIAGRDTVQMAGFPMFTGSRERAAGDG